MSLPSEKRVTLCVPGLFDAWPGSGPSPDLSWLQTLLARSDRKPNAVAGFEQRLFSLFGIHSPEATDLPVAAVTRIADMGVVDREWWVRADPVHLAPTRSGLVLRAGLGLSQSESDRLVAEINQALGADGWLLKAPSPERWYLKPARHVRIATTPLVVVAGGDVQPHLPTGEDSRAWNTRLNEIQILLHTAQVNVEREKRGALPANSVWFWGGGSLPAPGACEWTHVMADDPLARGLARLCSIPAADASAGANTVIGGKNGGDTLVVLEASPQAEAEGLARLEQEWLKPLKQAVERGELAELTVLSDNGPEYRYHRSHRLRFWRSPRRLFACRAA